MANDISEELQGEINKRLTLNMLIQGVATHALLTSHHLAAPELTALHPQLVDDYDRLAVSFFLNIWIGDLALVVGRPRPFWRRITRKSHPFHRHTLLVRHGAELSEAFRQYLLKRAKAKRVRTAPVLHLAQQVRLTVRVATREANLAEPLAAIARRTAATIWSIDEDRLDGEITTQTEFGNIRTPVTRTGRLLRSFAAGWGGVEPRDGRLMVVAKAHYWPLLMHELVKGTAELICLHGLNALPEGDYEQVLDAADHIEYESWHMQTGVILWRRLLELLPAGSSLAEMTMRLARLDPEPLELLMLAVVAEPDKARQILARL